MGIVFNLSDGTTQLLGNEPYPGDEYHLDRWEIDLKGARIRDGRISHYRRDNQTWYLNGIDFRMSDDEQYLIRPGRWKSTEYHWQDIDEGSGVLMGGQCSDGSCSSVAFYFLKAISRLSLEQVTYETTPMKEHTVIQQIEHERLNPKTGKFRLVFENRTDTDEVWSLREKTTDVQTFSWEIPISTLLGTQPSVTAPCFDLVEVHGKEAWCNDIKTNVPSTISETTTIEWHQADDLKAQTVVLVVLQYPRGIFQSRFHGTLLFRLQDGNEFRAPCVGMFAQTVFGAPRYMAEWHPLGL